MHLAGTATTTAESLDCGVQKCACMKLAVLSTDLSFFLCLFSRAATVLRHVQFLNEHVGVKWISLSVAFSLFTSFFLSFSKRQKTISSPNIQKLLNLCVKLFRSYGNEVRFNIWTHHLFSPFVMLLSFVVDWGSIQHAMVGMMMGVSELPRSLTTFPLSNHKAMGDTFQRGPFYLWVRENSYST